MNTTDQPLTHAQKKARPYQVLVNEPGGAVAAHYFASEVSMRAFVLSASKKVRGVYKYTTSKPWGYFDEIQVKGAA